MVDFPQKLYESDEKYAARLLPVLDATIARLQAVITNMLNAKENDVTHIRNTAWNDAIEEAYYESEQYPPDEMTTSERAAFIKGCMSARVAIRALKRPT